MGIVGDGDRIELALGIVAAQDDERLIVEIASMLGALLPGLTQYETQQDTLREEIEAARRAHMEHRSNSGRRQQR